jgi:hypothetical protein
LRIIENSSIGVGLRWEVTDVHSCSVADLGDGYQAYATAKSSNFRKQARRHAKKIADTGTWRIDRLDGMPPPNTISSYLDRMFTVAEAGWRARERGLDEERRHHPLYTMLLQKFARRGMADLSILSRDEEGHLFRSYYARRPELVREVQAPRILEATPSTSQELLAGTH